MHYTTIFEKKRKKGNGFATVFFFEMEEKGFGEEEKKEGEESFLSLLLEKQ